MRNLFVSLSFVLLASCAAYQQKDYLYRELGAQSGVEKIVDGMLDNIAKDDRIFELFKDAKIDRLHDKLVEQICHLSGGPCEYTGDSMEKAHGGMHITEAQFNALVEDLILAMEKEHVPVPAQNHLLALLAPMRSQIIYH